MTTSKKYNKEYAEGLALLKALKDTGMFEYTDNDIVAFAITLYHTLNGDIDRIEKELEKKENKN